MFVIECRNGNRDMMAEGNAALLGATKAAAYGVVLQVKDVWCSVLGICVVQWRM